MPGWALWRHQLCGFIGSFCVLNCTLACVCERAASEWRSDNAFKGTIEAIFRDSGELFLAMFKGHSCVMLLAFLCMCDIWIMLLLCLRAFLEYPVEGKNNITIER